MILSDLEKDALDKTLKAVISCMREMETGDYSEEYENFMLDLQKEEYDAICKVLYKILNET